MFGPRMDTNAHESSKTLKLKVCFTDVREWLRSDQVSSWIHCESLRCRECFIGGMRLLPVSLFVCGLAFGQDAVVVRALKFEHFKNVPVSEILDRLKEREVRLEVE